MSVGTESKSVKDLKNELESKTEYLKNLSEEKVALKKVRNLSDLKIIHKVTYDELQEDEKLIDKLISLKVSVIDSLSSKIVKLERSKKLEASQNKMLIDGNEYQRKMLEKYNEINRSMSKMGNSEKMNEIVKNLEMIKPVYKEYEDLEERYKNKLQELSELQLKKPCEKYGNSTFTCFLVFFISVLVVNILVGFQ